MIKTVRTESVKNKIVVTVTCDFAPLHCVLHGHKDVANQPVSEGAAAIELKVLDSTGHIALSITSTIPPQYIEGGDWLTLELVKSMESAQTAARIRLSVPTEEDEDYVTDDLAEVVITDYQRRYERRIRITEVGQYAKSYQLGKIS